jgi:hypothetical protein
MPHPELGKGLQARGDQFELCACERTHNGFASELLPPALCLTVVHDEIGVAQLTGRTEIEDMRRDAPIEDDGRVAQRAVGDRHWRATHHIIDDLVPDQDPQRIGAGVPADLEADHGLVGGSLLVLTDGFEDRMVDRRNAVLRRASR